MDPISPLLGLPLILSASLLTVWLGKLTVQGAITGFFVASSILLSSGLAGIAILGTFFITATLATSWKKNLKQTILVPRMDESKRNAKQVFANGGVAAIAAACVWLFPAYFMEINLIIVASLSSATADTLSSELGTVYGSKFFNVLSFKKDKRGENGVISVEGLLFGIAGSIMIAAVYSIAFGWDIRFLWIVLAGTIGNLADSVLGATLERRQFLGNNAVNFLNTLIAGLSILVFCC